MPRRVPLFVTAARGTEDLLADELTELGAARVRADRGGVRFQANLNEALRIALWSRIGMRLLWPLAEVEVHGAEGLYDAAHESPGRSTSIAARRSPSRPPSGTRSTPTPGSSP